MKTATVRDLRNDFARVAEWIDGGEKVQLTRHGKVIACIVPVRRSPKKPVEWPDFIARLKRIYGRKILPDSKALIDEMRNDR